MRKSAKEAGFECKSFIKASDDGASPYTTSDGKCSPLAPMGQSNGYDNVYSNHAPLCYCSPPDQCTGTVTNGVCSDMFGKFDFTRFQNSPVYIRVSNDASEKNLVLEAAGSSGPSARRTRGGGAFMRTHRARVGRPHRPVMRAHDQAAGGALVLTRAAARI